LNVKYFPKKRPTNNAQSPERSKKSSTMINHSQPPFNHVKQRTHTEFGTNSKALAEGQRTSTTLQPCKTENAHGVWNKLQSVGRRTTHLDHPSTMQNEECRRSVEQTPKHFPAGNARWPKDYPHHLF
jgi:hypothetical protein